MLNHDVWKNPEYCNQFANEILTGHNKDSLIKHPLDIASFYNNSKRKTFNYFRSKKCPTQSACFVIEDGNLSPACKYVLCQDINVFCCHKDFGGETKC